MVNIKDLKIGDKVIVHLCEGDFIDEVISVRPQIPGANKYMVELKKNVGSSSMKIS